MLSKTETSLCTQDTDLPLLEAPLVARIGTSPGHTAPCVATPWLADKLPAL